MAIHWIYLFLAGVFEIGFVVGVKLTDGFTKPLFIILTIACMLVSLVLMSLSLKGIPMGTGYAVWTSIGTVGAVIIGMLMFQEPVNIVKIVCLIFVIGGIIGLRLTSPA